MRTLANAQSEPGSILFDKQRQRRGVWPWRKLSWPTGADLAITEKPRQTERPELFLDHLRVVIWRAEKTLAASVATAQTAAINHRARELFARAAEQREQVFGRCLRVTPMKLHRLARPATSRPRRCPPTARIRADQRTHEKITAVKILEVIR